MVPVAVLVPVPVTVPVPGVAGTCLALLSMGPEGVMRARQATNLSCTVRAAAIFGVTGCPRIVEYRRLTCGVSVVSASRSIEMTSAN